MFSLEKQIVGSPFEISFYEGILQRVYNNLAEISVTHYSCQKFFFGQKRKK